MMQEENEWQNFLNFCVKLKTKKNFEEFFDLLFTLEEKEDLKKRIQVMHFLLKGELPQREIAKKINVSIFKITRGSNALKIISPRLKEFLKKELS